MTCSVTVTLTPCWYWPIQSLRPHCVPCAKTSATSGGGCLTARASGASFQKLLTLLTLDVPFARAVELKAHRFPDRVPIRKKPAVSRNNGSGTGQGLELQRAICIQKVDSGFQCCMSRSLRLLWAGSYLDKAPTNGRRGGKVILQSALPFQGIILFDVRVSDGA